MNSFVLAQCLFIVIGCISHSSIALNLYVKGRPLKATGVMTPKPPPPPQMKPSLYRTLKLPVWPIWNGVIAQVADWLNLKDVSNWLVNTIGGRVVPMQLVGLSDTIDTSPFLLLVHHSHSFTPFDPVRFLTQLVLPEGFPAHPHSGFDTMTYCMRGGLKHRDSEGIKMKYGDGDVQWMRAGRGVIHEEMWDVQENQHTNIEIFQLWVNLPEDKKQLEPDVKVLHQQDIPEWTEPITQSKIKIISGSILKAATASTSGTDKETSSDRSTDSNHINDNDNNDNDNGNNINIDNDNNWLRGPGGTMAQSPVAIIDVSMPPHQCLSVHLCDTAGLTTTATTKPTSGGSSSRGGSTVDTDSISALLYVRRGSYIDTEGMPIIGSQPPPPPQPSVSLQAPTAPITPRSTEVTQGDMLIFRPHKPAPTPTVTPKTSTTTTTTSTTPTTTSTSTSTTPTTTTSSTTMTTVVDSPLLTIQSGAQGLEGFVLLGEALREPVLWEGPLVQADSQGLQKSGRTFQQLPLDSFWSFRLNDTAWQKHITQLDLQGRISRSPE